VIAVVGPLAQRSRRGGTAEGDKVIYGGATYNQDCIRTSEGWRVQRHVEENPWIDDDGALLAMMTAKA
jgi:hypothetical protein